MSSEQRTRRLHRLQVSSSRRFLVVEDGAVGRPAIEGELAGHPATIVLDTGVEGGGVSEEAATKWFANLPRSSTIVRTQFGLSAAQVVGGVKGSAAGFPFRGDLVVVPHGQAGAGAMLGYDFLRNYRTTIDYRHQRVLLAPVAQPAHDPPRRKVSLEARDSPEPDIAPRRRNGGRRFA